MKTMLNSERTFIFVGPRKGLFTEPTPSGVSLCYDRFEVEAAVLNPSKCVTWISFSRRFTDVLLKKAVTARADLRGSQLLMLTPPRPASIPALLGLFHPVFGLVEGVQWLPNEELVAAIQTGDASDRMIGGSVDPQAKTLTLLRGDLTVVVVPFSFFPRAGDGTSPDFTRLGLTDHGRTIALGDYEAAADAVLYELDPDYRRRLKSRRRQTERTFGAALTRLRTQRRLKRGDFAPISAKEIARLERNEVVKPHAQTLTVVAARLGVRPEEIEGY